MHWIICFRMLNAFLTIVTKMTLTFSRIIDFDDATNLFLKQVYSCAAVDACLLWTDLIILISRPLRWDKLDQSTHFKGKLHKLPIKMIPVNAIWLIKENKCRINFKLLTEKICEVVIVRHVCCTIYLIKPCYNKVCHSFQQIYKSNSPIKRAQFAPIWIPATWRYTLLQKRKKCCLTS